MPEYIRILIAAAALVVVTAVIQVLYSDVSRGLPFWKNLWKAMLLDVGLLVGIGSVLCAIVWAIPGLT